METADKNATMIDGTGNQASCCEEEKPMKNKQPFLQTDRLVLGPIRQQDAAAMAEIFRSEAVGKTYMLPEFQCDDEVTALFQRFQVLSVSPTAIVYGIFLDDQLIGFCNHVSIEETSVEMGYVIHPHWQNHGYASEAFHAVIQELFRIGYKCVKAGAFSENPASMRVMEKCGMERTLADEEISYRGQVHRCVNYRICAADI